MTVASARCMSSRMKNRTLGTSLGWKTLASRLLHETRWFQMREDKVDLKGREITYTYIDHPGAAFVVPVTTKGEIVLIKIYRYTIDDWCWEIPSGGFGDKRDKDIETIAREEMHEEAGCTGGTLENMGWFYTANGIMNLKAHFFLARDVKMERSEPEETEHISQIELVSPEEARRAVETGRVNDGESALGIMLALARLNASKENVRA